MATKAPARPKPRPKVPKPAPTVAAPAPGALPIRDERLARDGKRKRVPSHHDVNPLREGLRLERVPDPHVMVLFGASRLPAKAGWDGSTRTTSQRSLPSC